MIKKDNFGTRSNSKLAASGPIKAGTTNANLGGKSVVARSNTPAQDPNLGRLVLTTIIQDIPKYSIDGEGNQVAINYTSLQIPKEKELRHPLVAGIQVSLVSGNFSQLITITSTLALNDTTISVASFNPNVDIGKGALICIDEEDLFNQYQNKTKGTIAGFTVDSDGIAKSGIEITDWLNSDTMTGASVNNVPTALSVKNYVDNSHPAEDQTLQEVTDNGNTTTNSITFAGGTSTAQLYGTSIQLGDGTINERIRVYYSDGSYMTMRGYGLEMNRVSSYIRPTSTNTTDLYIGNQTLSFSQLELNSTTTLFKNGTAELMRLTSTGLGIGTSSPASKLHVVSADEIVATIERNSGSGYAVLNIKDGVGTTGNSVIRFSDTLASKGQINYEHANDSLSINTAGAERMRITSAGNVGIGTSSPTEKLEVVGDIKLSTSNASYYLKIENNLSYANPFNLISAFGLEVLSVNSGQISTATNANANFGIGTSSPSEKLHVVGDSLVTGDSHADAFKPDGTGEPIKFKNFASTELVRITDAGLVGIGTSSPTGKLNIVSSSSGSYLLNLDYNDNTDGGGFYQSGSTGLTLFLKNSSAATKVQISSESTSYFNGGNFGIGTSSPSEKLDVVGNIKTTGIAKFYNSTSHYGSINADSEGLTLDTVANRHMRFKKAGVEVMRINTSGNVGIGTSSPSVNLQVYDALSSQIKITNGLATPVDLQLFASSSSYAGIGTSTNHRLALRTNNSEKLTILGDGNVGIGTSSPSEKLEVDGRIKLQTTAGFLVAQEFGAGSVKLTSSATLGIEAPSNFRVKTGPSLDENLTVLSTGNVGIGSTSPNRLLTLSASGGTYQAFNSTSNNNTTIGSDGTGAFIVYDDTASSYRMVIKATTGNVLIGTTTDSSARLKSLSANGNGFSLMLGRADTNNLWRFNHAGNDLRIYNQATSGSNIILGADAGGTAEANNVLIGTGTDNGDKLQVNGVASATTFAGDLRGTINTLTTGVTQTANDNSTKIATTAYVDSAEAGTSSFGSFTPTSTQSIASGGNVGVKSTLLLATSQVTASNITTSSAGLTFANAGLYQISFNFASKVSGTANRTLAAANLEYSADGETWTEIVGSLVYNYDRGTATSGGASSWGFVYDGSASCSFIHNLATSSKIRARFWIEGRASSASGITTIINGCRLSAHKIG